MVVCGGVAGRGFHSVMVPWRGSGAVVSWCLVWWCGVAGAGDAVVSWCHGEKKKINLYFSFFVSPHSVAKK